MFEHDHKPLCFLEDTEDGGDGSTEEEEEEKEEEAEKPARGERGRSKSTQLGQRDRAPFDQVKVCKVNGTKKRSF